MSDLVCINCDQPLRYDTATQSGYCINCEITMYDKPTPPSADDIQAGGQHYKEMAIQPWHLMEAILTPEEFIGYLKGNLIKYGMRQGRKDSPDADKWRHYKQKLDEVTSKSTWG